MSERVTESSLSFLTGITLLIVSFQVMSSHSGITLALSLTSILLCLPMTMLLARGAMAAVRALSAVRESDEDGLAADWVQPYVDYSFVPFKR